MIKIYASSTDGRYLGDFDGSVPQEPHIEVNVRPVHGQELWDGTQWNPSDELILERWRRVMRKSDLSLMPRWFEDYITENSVTLAPGRAKDSYDAKVALRAGRPV